MTFLSELDLNIAVMYLLYMLKMRSIGQMVQKLSFGNSVHWQTDVRETFIFLLSWAVMSSLFDENRKFYICGDFNIWAEDDTDDYAKRFLEVIGNFNYKNAVCEPTSRSGHILYLVMCDELDDDLV